MEEQLTELILPNFLVGAEGEVDFDPFEIELLELEEDGIML